MENSPDQVKDATSQEGIPAEAPPSDADAPPQDAPPSEDAQHSEDAPLAEDSQPAQETDDAATAEGAEEAERLAERTETPPASPPAEDSPDATVEAILFAADAPLPPARIGQIGRLPAKIVRECVARLNDRYQQIGAAYRIEEIAGGFQMLTLSRFRDVLERLYSTRSESRLTPPAMETLAIIAYRQPVLRADVEAIRGVACGEVLRGLMEKQLIRIVGRAQVLGRPLLYGTTRKFLEVFGLGSLEDLPKSEELRAPAQKLDTPAPAAGEAAAPTGEAVAAAGETTPAGDSPQAAAQAQPAGAQSAAAEAASTAPSETRPQESSPATSE